MDLLKVATDLFLNKLGESGINLDPQMVSQALSALLGSGSGQLDLGALVSQLGSSGLGSLAQSWLGDGENQSFSVDQLVSLLGESKLANFSESLSLEGNVAGNALAEMLPQLIDQNSSAGGLLDSVGGVGGLASMASKFFG